jgi:hypothetical protein
MYPRLAFSSRPPRPHTSIWLSKNKNNAETSLWHTLGVSLWTRQLCRVFARPLTIMVWCENGTWIHNERSGRQEFCRQEKCLRSSNTATVLHPAGRTILAKSPCMQISGYRSVKCKFLPCAYLFTPIEKCAHIYTRLDCIERRTCKYLFGFCCPMEDSQKFRAMISLLQKQPEFIQLSRSWRKCDGPVKTIVGLYVRH